METQSIPIDVIETGERHRALSDDAVARIAASMREIGLRQPISIRITDDVMIDGEPCDGVPILVAGAHRLAAAKQLGWSHIDCFEIADDPVEAELWEIAENLHRCDLTKEQRDEHIRRYAELLESKAELISQQSAPKLKSPSNPKGAGRAEGTASKIAKATGLSKDTVRRALKPKAPPPEPKAPLTDEEVITAQYNSLMSAWNKAGLEAREMFLAEVDTPVFDNTKAAA